jgi:adenosine deaminase/aminodeoxyfutalosine deaminase
LTTVTPEFIERLPKAELHLHLEGSLTPETLRELDPSVSVQDARLRYRCSDFAGFIEAFKWAVGFLRSADDYAFAARRLFEELARQNVRYAEVTLSAGVVLWKGLDFGPVYEAVAREAARAPMPVWLVLDAIRHFGAEHAMQVARLAADRAEDRVVAFGVGGDESRGPLEWFGKVFAFCRESGLKLVPHAGENTHAAAVWSAVRLGADRIGHGIRAIEDAALVRELAARKIPLEISITSNVITGAVPRLDAHPVRRLYDAGVPLILNTDDPAMFGVSLNDEYLLAARQFGFTANELKGLAEASLAWGFRRALTV